MNIAEAFQALMHGKKVRKKYWPQSFWMKIESGMFVNSDGKLMYLNLTSDEASINSWEIIDEKEITDDKKNLILDEISKRLEELRNL